jgi:uncharacterized protein (DUF58 family)
MPLLTKIKTQLVIHSRRKVTGLLEGQYASLHAGRSLDFSDLRDYIPGDDVSDIDWKASARQGSLLVKRYVADRKHTLFLVVDTGREMTALASWGVADDAGEVKRELAITAAGIFGWIAIRHGDYVGLICRGEDGPTIQRPSTRELDLERMLELVEASCQDDSPSQDTLGLLDYAIRSVRRRTIMVLVTSGLDIDPEAESMLRRLLVQHELILVTIGDVDPTEPGRAGRRVRDVSTGRYFPGFAARSARLAGELATADAERRERRRASLTRLGVSSVELDNAAELIPAVLALIDGMRHAR